MFEDFEEIKLRCKEAGLEFEEFDEGLMEMHGYDLIVFIRVAGIGAASSFTSMMKQAYTRLAS